MSENRHPAGTSIGGQWAPGSASEVEDSLETPETHRIDDIDDACQGMNLSEDQLNVMSAQWEHISSEDGIKESETFASEQLAQFAKAPQMGKKRPALLEAEATGKDHRGEDLYRLTASYDERFDETTGQQVEDAGGQFSTDDDNTTIEFSDVPAQQCSWQVRSITEYDDEHARFQALGQLKSGYDRTRSPWSIDATTAESERQFRTDFAEAKTTEERKDVLDRRWAQGWDSDPADMPPSPATGKEKL